MNDTIHSFIQQCLDDGDSRADIVAALEVNFDIKKSKAYKLISQVKQDADFSVPLDDSGNIALLPLAEQMISRAAADGDLAEARRWWELVAKAKKLI